MALTTKQLERRRKSLGGSDIATLMGHDRRSEYDLWLEKKHGTVTFDGNDATEYGTWVEGGIADWVAYKLDVRIRKNVFRAHPNLPFHANLDAVVVGLPEAVEVKTSAYEVETEWREPGTDEVPHKVVCQCQWQSGIADLERVHIGAGLSPSFGGNKLRYYLVERHQDLIDYMFEVGSKWWERYIVGDDVPTDLPSHDAIKAIERTPNFEKVIDRDLVAELLQAKADAKEANALVKDLTAQLHAALYDPKTKQWAEVGVIDDDTRVTYFQHMRKGYQVHGGPYRQLRLPKEV